MDFKAQSSIEYLAVVGLGLLMATPFIGLVQQDVINLRTDSQDARFTSSLDEMESAIERADALGDSAQTSFTLNVPDNIVDARVVDDRNIVFTQNRSGQLSNRTVILGTNVQTSNLPLERGRYSMKAEAESGFVRVRSSDLNSDFFSASITDYDQVVERGDIFNATYEIENTGGEEGTQDVEYSASIAGSESFSDFREFNLDPNEENSEDVEWSDTNAESLGEYIFEVETDNDSDSRTFKLLEEPDVNTEENGTVTESSAELNGEVISTGGEDVDAFFEYRKTEDSTWSNTDTENTGQEEFSETVTGLEPATNYEFRAVGENSLSTNIGAEKQFTTGGGEAFFEVDIDESESDGVVEQGETFNANYTVENTGDTEGTQNIAYNITKDGNEVYSNETHVEDLTLDEGEESNIKEIEWDASGTESGFYNLSVISVNSSDRFEFELEQYLSEYGQLVMDDNPEGYWKLDEESGTTAIDETGNYDGSIEGSPDLGVEGADGTAINFDGDGQYVEIDGYSGVTGSDTRTVEAWVKPESGVDYTVSENTHVVDWGLNNNGERYSIRLSDEGGGDPVLRVEVQGGFKYGSTQLDREEWNHIAVVLPEGSSDVTDHRLYVNGELDSTGEQASQTIDTAEATAFISRNNEQDRDFIGSVDEVAIYNEELAEQSIEERYTTITGQISTEGLFGHWDATQIEASDGDNVEEWIDISGRGNDAVQSDSGNRPSLQEDITSTGKPGVEFNTSEWLETDYNPSEDELADDSTLFIVAEWFSTQNNGRFPIGSWGDPRFYFGQRGDDDWQIGYGDGWGRDGQSVQNEIVSARVAHDGDGEVEAFVNGELQVRTGEGDSSAEDFSEFSGANDNDLFLGRLSGEDRDFDGHIFEIMLYERELTTEEVDEVEEYLEDKWGLN